jgi:hypothetical protein
MSIQVRKKLSRINVIHKKILPKHSYETMVILVKECSSLDMTAAIEQQAWLKQLA